MQPERPARNRSRLDAFGAERAKLGRPGAIVDRSRELLLKRIAELYRVGLQETINQDVFGAPSRLDAKTTEPEAVTLAI